MTFYIILSASLSALLAVLTPKIVDKLKSRSLNSNKFCIKAKKELTDNGYDCKMDEGWLVVNLRKYSLMMYFVENKYSNGFCVLVRTYAYPKDLFPTINGDGIRFLMDYANHKCTLKLYTNGYEPDYIIVEHKYYLNRASSIVQILNDVDEYFNSIFRDMGNMYSEMQNYTMYRNVSSKGSGNPIGFRSNVDKNVASDANVEESADAAAKSNTSVN